MLHRLMRYDACASTAFTPLPPSAVRKATDSPAVSGFAFHCRWLRVKIWMTVASMRRLLQVAIGTYPSGGTCA